MAQVAARRIAKEMKDWRQNPLDHIHVEYWDDSNIHQWKVVMIGPEGTPYCGGHYKLNVDLSENYPMHSMNIKFVTKIYCCNVSEEGMISTDLFGENWSTKYTVKHILQSIYHKCFIEAGDYDFNCVLRTDLNRLLFQNTEQFVINALQWNHKYAHGIDSEFYNFPQIDPSEFQERMEERGSAIAENTVLSAEFINEHLMPFVANQQSDCSLFGFITKFQSKQKYQGTVWNSDTILKRDEYDFIIKIKLLSGDIEAIEVKANDTVYYLKQMLAAKLQTPLKQRLLFDAVILDDGKKLCEYDITEGSMLHLVIRCRGGC